MQIRQNLHIWKCNKFLKFANDVCVNCFKLSFITKWFFYGINTFIFVIVYLIHVLLHLHILQSFALISFIFLFSLSSSFSSFFSLLRDLRLSASWLMAGRQPVRKMKLQSISSLQLGVLGLQRSLISLAIAALAHVLPSVVLLWPHLQCLWWTDGTPQWYSSTTIWVPKTS